VILTQLPNFSRVVGIVVLSVIYVSLMSCDAGKSAINVGVLHSLSGTMQVSERPVALATQMAIDEINAQGGLLGRQINPIVYDGQSDDNVFYRFANKLIREQNVKTVFGCWTSSCRKTLKPLFEQTNNLLVYPVQFEGVENSKNILYTGSTAAQQVMPAISWGGDFFGERIMLIGSDYIYPRVTNEIVRDQIAINNFQLVDEVYFNLGDEALDGLKERILNANPNFILSTLNGSSNVAFVRILSELNQYPVIATSISEEELAGSLPTFPLYVANSYFQTLSSVQNQQFIKRFKAYAGLDVSVSAAVEAAYSGVKLWAAAVIMANSFQPVDVKKVMPMLSVDGVVDPIHIALDGSLSWRKFYLAQFNDSGQLQVIDSSLEALAPNPYPVTRQTFEWQSFVEQLRMNWGNQWRAPEVVRSAL